MRMDAGVLRISIPAGYTTAFEAEEGWGEVNVFQDARNSKGFAIPDYIIRFTVIRGLKSEQWGLRTELFKVMFLKLVSPSIPAEALRVIKLISVLKPTT